MGQKKAFVDFETSQETTDQAIIRAINRSSLSQEQREEICCLLDEEMGKVKIVSMEVQGADSFVFEEDESDGNEIIKALIFNKK